MGEDEEEGDEACDEDEGDVEGEEEAGEEEEEGDESAGEPTGGDEGGLDVAEATGDIMGEDGGPFSAGLRTAILSGAASPDVGSSSADPVTAAISEDTMLKRAALVAGDGGSALHSALQAQSALHAALARAAADGAAAAVAAAATGATGSPNQGEATTGEGAGGIAPGATLAPEEELACVMQRVLEQRRLRCARATDTLAPGPAPPTSPPACACAGTERADFAVLSAEGAPRFRLPSSSATAATAGARLSPLPAAAVPPAGAASATTTASVSPHPAPSDAPVASAATDAATAEPTRAAPMAKALRVGTAALPVPSPAAPAEPAAPATTPASPTASTARPSSRSDVPVAPSPVAGQATSPISPAAAPSAAPAVAPASLVTSPPAASPAVLWASLRPFLAALVSRGDEGHPHSAEECAALLAKGDANPTAVPADILHELAAMLAAAPAAAAAATATVTTTTTTSTGTNTVGGSPVSPHTPASAAAASTTITLTADAAPPPPPQQQPPASSVATSARPTAHRRPTSQPGTMPSAIHRAPPRAGVSATAASVAVPDAQAEFARSGRTPVYCGGGTYDADASGPRRTTGGEPATPDGTPARSPQSAETARDEYLAVAVEFGYRQGVMAAVTYFVERAAQLQRARGAADGNGSAVARAAAYEEAWSPRHLAEEAERALLSPLPATRPSPRTPVHGELTSPRRVGIADEENGTADEGGTADRGAPLPAALWSPSFMQQRLYHQQFAVGTAFASPPTSAAAPNARRRLAMPPQPWEGDSPLWVPPPAAGDGILAGHARPSASPGEVALGRLPPRASSGVDEAAKQQQQFASVARLIERLRLGGSPAEQQIMV